MSQNYTPEFSKECQTDPQAKEDYDSMKENIRLKRENEEFGTRWLLRRPGICPNACCNYRKHRKADSYAQKAEVLGKIDEICRRRNGVDGYRIMTAYLEREGCSPATHLHVLCSVSVL